MHKRFTLLAALALVAGFLTLLSAPAQATRSEGATAVAAAAAVVKERARVVEVTDGDSIKVRLIKSGAPRNVRLIGIDTPETHGHVECGGPRASRSLEKMLPVGQVVKLVTDPQQDNRDLFNRLLRYVVKPGGKDVGRRQVAKGWARIFIFGGESFDRVPSYRKARKAAKRDDRGTWGLC
jgi:endonuclease YncB( thermonuclease family)